MIVSCIVLSAVGIVLVLYGTGTADHGLRLRLRCGAVQHGMALYLSCTALSGRGSVYYTVPLLLNLYAEYCTRRLCCGRVSYRCRHLD